MKVICKHQQGDVVLKEVGSQALEYRLRRKGDNGKGLVYKPSIVTSNSSINSKVVLALGEATGHSHSIDMSSLLPNVQITTYTTKDRYRWRGFGGETEQNLGEVPDFIKIEGSEVKLQHEEHNTLTIPPGTYEVNIVREMDHLNNIIREVAD